jgi:hypothetical protein
MVSKITFNLQVVSTITTFHKFFHTVLRTGKDYLEPEPEPPYLCPGAGPLELRNH